VLLLGVLVMGYGYFHQSMPAIYLGLGVIGAGVIYSLVRILMYSDQ
jgi:hypothetical protein